MASAYQFMVKSLMEKDPCLRAPVEHVARTLRGMDQCLTGSLNNCATDLSAAATEGASSSDSSNSSSPIPDAESCIDYRDALAKLDDRVHLSHCLKAFYRKYNPTKSNDMLDAVIDMYGGSDCVAAGTWFCLFLSPMVSFIVSCLFAILRSPRVPFVR
jgi:hypothetical protein